MSDVLVWFDGACPLCRREIAWMRRLDRRNAIAFVDVSRAAATDGAGCPIDRSALLARFHALEDGRVLSGAAAFAAGVELHELATRDVGLEDIFLRLTSDGAPAIGRHAGPQGEVAA